MEALSKERPLPIRDNRVTGWLAASIAFLVLLVFGPAIGFDYLQYDDGVYVFENAFVVKGFSWGGLVYAFSSIDGGSWMPVTWLSLMLDRELFGNAAWGHHLTNVILHASCAVAGFLALNRITKETRLSWLVAAAFALHPLRTESVVWIAERKDVLSGLFWMLGILAYHGFVTAQRPRRLRWVAICLILGLMAKPMLVTFPFALLLIDFWPLRRIDFSQSLKARGALDLIREKAWLFVIVGGFCVLTYWSQDRSGAISHPGPSTSRNLLEVAANYGFYVQKIVWPCDRTVLYPPIELGTVNSAMGIGLVGLITVLAFALARRKPWLAFGWGWFLGTFVPVIGLVRIGYTTVADRYSYIPSIGFFIAVAWTVRDWAGVRPWRRRLSAVGGVVLVAAMAIGTWRDLPRWKDSGALFRAALRIAPHRVALNNLAYFHIGRGEYAAAVEACNQAIELNPDYGQSYGNRALAYAWLEDYEQAKADYDQAVRLGARPIQPMQNRVSSTGQPIVVPTSNDPEEAWHYFATAFKLEPRTARSLQGRADMRLKWGDLRGALQDYDRAIQCSPAIPELYTRRGNIQVRLGNSSAALSDMTHAIELEPGNAAHYQNRAVVYYQLRDFEKARADVAKCRELGGLPHESFLRALEQAGGLKP